MRGIWFLEFLISVAVMPLFQTCGLCKHFRQGSHSLVRALHDVTLSIVSGSFVLLTGPSGSGKTTLLALLGALERPTSGHVLIDGNDLTELSGMELARVRRRLGFVFQNFSLIGGLPVWENITYPLIPRGVSSHCRLEIAKTLLDDLGLSDRLESRPGELSGGEQQRVAFARALAGKPEVLLADEPTSNLDPEAAQSLLEQLRKSHAAGMTVILAGHDPRAVPMATQVYELEAGRLKQGK
jgi:putative ABC transport system ATP-binding protein